MKRQVLFLVACLMVGMAFGQNQGQNLQYYAFDTNGEMGKCLFPINENGEDEIKGVVECEGKTAAEIAEKVKKWAYETTSKYDMKVDDRYDGSDLVAFRGTVKLGLNVLSVDYGFVHIGDFARYNSEIKFKCRVEIKDGKFRYIFNDFQTDRRTIHGEGKSSGPENRLHWQRVNSLTKERDAVIGGRQKLSKSKQEEVDAYNEQIKFEELTYEQEYKTFCDMIDGLKNCFRSNYDF